MKITAIKQQVKNPERVSVFVDGQYSFSLTLDQLLEQKIKKDTELDDVRLKQLIKLSEEGKLRARTLEWLMRRPHSTQELRNYLYKKKIEKDLIEKMVLELTDKKYLNDVEFARWFAENRLRKNKSKRAITAELMSKGIPKNIAESVLSEFQSDESSDKDSLKQLIAKLRTRTRYQEEQKLKQYLLSKGFKWSDIREVLSLDDES